MMPTPDQPPTNGSDAGWRTAFGSTEGTMFITGAVFAVLYLVSTGLLRIWNPDLSQALIEMTTTHVIGGRAAGISWGYVHEMTPWMVMAVNLAIEAILVLLFFPIFVFSYRRWIVPGPLQRTLARARTAAEQHKAQIIRFGIPGLFLFVWFPFWMTGPLVGCVIGFLIGLRPVTNVAVVLSGTAVAIFCWSIALQKLHARLEALGPYVPFVFVGLVFFVAVAVHIHYVLHNHDDEDPIQ